MERLTEVAAQGVSAMTTIKNRILMLAAEEHVRAAPRVVALQPKEQLLPEAAI